MASMEITQLIERCKQGDSEALGELYQTYSSKMRGVCRRYVSDKETINDVLHDSFVIILTSLNKLRDNSKAEGWMMSITRNVASKYKDYQKKHPTVAFDKAERVLFDEDEDKEVKEISMTELMSLIDKLPEGYGKVFRLAVFEGLSHKEIAAMLNIEPHSSSSQLARAKRLLRKMIQQSWVILLLLLIIPAIILIKKEKTINNDDSSVVVQKENTPTTQPIEQNQIPTVVFPQPTQNTTVAADAQKSADDYSNKFVVPDTVTTIVVKEEIVADTSHDFQQRDTIQFNTKTETPHYNLADIFPNDGNGETMRTSSPQWSLEFAYAGSFDEQNFTSQVINLQDIDEGTGKSLIPIVSEDDTIQYTNYHYMPITLTLTAHYRQSKRLGVEAGLSYIRLVSDFEAKKDSVVNREQLQTIHYIGVPVKAIYYIYNLKGWNVYGNLGLAMNIPVRSQFNENGLLHNGTENIGTAYTHIPLLWSLSTGFGLQYNLSPHVGIFAEPNVLYYLPTQGGLETYCTEHPFTFSLPVGIKFIW